MPLWPGCYGSRCNSSVRVSAAFKVHVQPRMCTWNQIWHSLPVEKHPTNNNMERKCRRKPSDLVLSLSHRLLLHVGICAEPPQGYFRNVGEENPVYLKGGFMQKEAWKVFQTKKNGCDVSDNEVSIKLALVPVAKYQDGTLRLNQQPAKHSKFFPSNVRQMLSVRTAAKNSALLYVWIRRCQFNSLFGLINYTSN